MGSATKARLLSEITTTGGSRGHEIDSDVAAVDPYDAATPPLRLHGGDRRGPSALKSGSSTGDAGTIFLRQAGSILK